MSNSIGNLKNSGLQGNNFPWQLKMLYGQQCACDQLKLANDILQDIDDNTDQVEPLLLQILSAIQNGSDFEAFLVVDNAGVTWLEVRIWNPATSSFDPPVYFAANSNTPGTPAFPVSYINPNSYLAQIASYTSNLISIEAGIPNALGQTTMSASMPVTIASNQTAIPVTAIDLDIRDLDCATDSVSICAGGNPITSTTVGATTGLDVNVISASLQNNIDSKEETNTTGDLSGFGPNITSISFMSVGTANALVSVNGGSTFFPVAPGSTVNLTADGPNGFYLGTSFFWDTATNSGASLVIIYNYI